MTVSTDALARQTGVRDHGFHPLRVRRIVPETHDTISLELDIPPDRQAAFAYRAGQFLTFRVRIDGEQHLRSYSMASSPEADEQLSVTVKRVPGGVVSNRLVDTMAPGDTVESTRPAGVFCLDDGAGDVVGFAAGSGITPVYSVLKTALAVTPRRVRLLYANRDHDSVIFGADLDTLGQRYADRLEVVHHLDVDSGFIDSSDVAAFVDSAPDTSYYICGPAPFMDVVERQLLDDGVDPDRIHIERFTPLPPPEDIPSDDAPAADAGAESDVTIELGGQTQTGKHRSGTTILQMARQLGMKPPSSCENGDCATCMAKIVEGSATMRQNNALFDDEVADGWILTCQAEPDTPQVHVVYED
ncbi:MAG TPA: ferredoxin--NADP reductase [Mycobacteriales bacterium]|nr:ferredoxin--NADP reductase [Mycobacteriales bacterium]